MPKRKATLLVCIIKYDTGQHKLVILFDQEFFKGVINAISLVCGYRRLDSNLYAQ